MFVPIVLACQVSPYSKWRIHLLEEDQLTDSDRVQLFMANSEATSASGYAALAKLYANQGDFNKALLAIQKAIHLDPVNTDYHTMKADFAFAEGNHSVAYNEALTAYHLGTKSLDQSLRLTRIAVVLSEFSIVNEIIDSLVDAYPNDGEVLYFAARKHDKMGHKNMALSLYRKVNELQPQDQENNTYYARCMIDNGMPLQAILFINENHAMEEYPASLMKADAFYALDLLDSAAKYYKLTVISSPDTVIYSRLLNIYTKSARKDSLINIARAALVDFPENKQYLHLLARTLDSRYRFDEALPFYKRLYKMDTLDTLVASELAYLQRKIAYLQRKKAEERQLADSLAQSSDESNIN